MEEKKRDLSGHILGTFEGEKLTGIEREQALSNFIRFAANTKLDPNTAKLILRNSFDFKTDEEISTEKTVINKDDGEETFKW